MRSSRCLNLPYWSWIKFWPLAHKPSLPPSPPHHSPDWCGNTSAIVSRPKRLPAAERGQNVLLRLRHTQPGARITITWHDRGEMSNRRELGAEYKTAVKGTEGWRRWDGTGWKDWWILLCNKNIGSINSWARSPVPPAGLLYLLEGPHCPCCSQLGSNRVDSKYSQSTAIGDVTDADCVLLFGIQGSVTRCCKPATPPHLLLLRKYRDHNKTQMIFRHLVIFPRLLRRHLLQIQYAACWGPWSLHWLCSRLVAGSVAGATWARAVSKHHIEFLKDFPSSCSSE